MKKLIFTKYANQFSPKRKREFRAAMITELGSYGYQVT